jgi:hypothetical protein
MKRTIGSDGMIKEGDDNVMVYYHSKYLFSKLKYRIENDEKKIKIGETIKVELKVIDLGKIE